MVTVVRGRDRMSSSNDEDDNESNDSDGDGKWLLQNVSGYGLFRGTKTGTNWRRVSIGDEPSNDGSRIVDETPRSNKRKRKGSKYSGGTTDTYTTASSHRTSESIRSRKKMQDALMNQRLQKAAYQTFQGCQFIRNEKKQLQLGSAIVNNVMSTCDVKGAQNQATFWAEKRETFRRKHIKRRNTVQRTISLHMKSKYNDRRPNIGQTSVCIICI